MREESVIMDFSEFQNREPPKIKHRSPLKPINHYDMEGVFLRTYKDINEAFKETKINKESINKCCHGEKLHIPSAQSIFLFDGDDIEERMQLIEKKTTTRIVYEYDLEGNLLHTYYNHIAAALANNISIDTIRSCLKGKTLTANKKIFLQKGSSIEDRLKLIEERNKLNKKWMPVKEYSLKGEFIRDWPNMSSIQKYYGVKGDISLCCSGKTLTAIGKIFLYPEDSIEERLEKLSHRRHKPSTTKRVKIIEYDLEGNYVKKWNSMTEAEKFYNIPQGSICHCCKGNRLMTHGKIFLYERHSIAKRLQLINPKNK